MEVVPAVAVVVVVTDREPRDEIRDYSRDYEVRVVKQKFGVSGGLMRQPHARTIDQICADCQYPSISLVWIMFESPEKWRISMAGVGRRDSYQLGCGCEYCWTYVNGETPGTPISWFRKDTVK